MRGRAAPPQPGIHRVPPPPPGCDTGSYVGYTQGHLVYTRVDGHKSMSSSVRKHYDNDHAGAVPEDLLSCFKVLKKCHRQPKLASLQTAVENLNAL